MARHVVLLRGINLGSRNRVPMKELRTALEEAGYEHVNTVLQSGNLVVTSSQSAQDVADEIEDLVEAEFGVVSPVVVRSRAQIASVVKSNPLEDVADDGKKYQVIFLSERPSAAAVREIESAEIGDEQVAVVGREIYCWHANGIQKSPLSKVIDKAGLEGVATARNWNTVLKLRDLAG